jgi:hypothetical protein
MAAMIDTEATTGGDEEAEIELVARTGGRLAKESVS